MSQDLLTREEVQALGLVARGATMAGAARTMNVSESTLGRILRRARQKLGAKTTIEAVSAAIRRGLI